MQVEVEKSKRYIFAFQAKHSQIPCFPFRTSFILLLILGDLFQVSKLLTLVTVPPATLLVFSLACGLAHYPYLCQSQQSPWSLMVCSVCARQCAECFRTVSPGSTEKKMFRSPFYTGGSQGLGSFKQVAQGQTTSRWQRFPLRTIRFLKSSEHIITMKLKKKKLQVIVSFQIRKRYCLLHEVFLTILAQRHLALL